MAQLLDGLFQAVLRLLRQDPVKQHLVEGAENRPLGDGRNHILANHARPFPFLDDLPDEVQVLEELHRHVPPHEFAGLAQFDLHYLGQVLVLLDHEQVLGDEGPHLFERIAHLGNGFPHPLDPKLHLLFEERDQDIVFVFEIEIDGAVRHACFACNLGNLRVVEALFRKNLYSGLDNLVVFSPVFFFEGHTDFSLLRPVEWGRGWIHRISYMKS